MTVTQICTSNANGKVTPMSNDKWLKCMEVMWTATWLSLRTQVIYNANDKEILTCRNNTNGKVTITDNSGDKCASNANERMTQMCAADANYLSKMWVMQMMKWNNFEQAMQNDKVNSMWVIKCQFWKWLESKWLKCGQVMSMRILIKGVQVMHLAKWVKCVQVVWMTNYHEFEQIMQNEN